MKVLLSIKPEFAEKIFKGTKKYEFRKKIFKNPEIKIIVVYVSSPVQKIIGEFEIETIYNEYLGRLWHKTKQFAGIDKVYFYEYFSNVEKGYAIKIKAATLYSTPLCIKANYNLSPPQSFLYLNH